MSEYQYYIQKIDREAVDTIIIEAGDKRGFPIFDYRPGQYVMLSYTNAEGNKVDKHAFSIASSPTQKNSLRFGIKIQGQFTQGLLNLQVGDDLYITGPFGDFCYEENKYSEVVMIAGGIGITPFISALNYATDLGLPNKLSLIYSAKSVKSLTFFEEIKKLVAINSNLSVLFSLSDEPEPIVDKDVLKQRVTAQNISDFVGPVLGKTYFICGPSAFMAAMFENLIKLGVNKNQIRLEEFSMIPDKKLGEYLKNMAYALGVALLIFGLSFTLISRPKQGQGNSQIAVAEVDNASVLNRAVYERMTHIVEAKNKALASIKQSDQRALKSPVPANINNVVSQSAPKNIIPATGSQPAAASTPVPTPIPVAPVVTPAPIIKPTPVVSPAPVPTTRVS